MKRYDYENMLALIQGDLKNYKHRLRMSQPIEIIEDICSVIEKVKNKY